MSCLPFSKSAMPMPPSAPPNYADSWRSGTGWRSQKTRDVMLQAAEKATTDLLLWLECAQRQARVQQFEQALTSLDKIPTEAPADIVLKAMRLRW